MGFHKSFKISAKWSKERRPVNTFKQKIIKKKIEAGHIDRRRNTIMKYKI